MRLGKRFDLEGSSLALDFVNTNHFWDGEPPQEDLESYADLLAWAQAAGALDAAQARGLQRSAETDPRAAQRAFKEAMALRESLYRVIQSRTQAKQPPASHLATMNAALSESLARLQLSGTAELKLTWKRSGDLESVLWPVMRDAAELLVSDEAARIRQCGGEACTWFFVDRSRNGMRRWCDMTRCGNREKVSRFRERNAKRTAKR